ncbi:hypothetical protein D3C73_1221640 [compost metagenome]
MGVLLNDLYTLACGNQFPIAPGCFRVVLAQGLNLGLVPLGNLLDEVSGEVHVVLGHGQHGDDVSGTDGQRKVQVAGGLQEVGGEAGVRAEEEGALAVHIAGIQVGDGHGRRADGRLTVYLCAVL